MNTDFIDNAGGVDCSDHEVNLKILFNQMVADGRTDVKQRNQLLTEMTEERRGSGADQQLPSVADSFDRTTAWPRSG